MDSSRSRLHFKTSLIKTNYLSSPVVHSLTRTAGLKIYIYIFIRENVVQYIHTNYVRYLLVFFRDFKHDNSQGFESI